MMTMTKPDTNESNGDELLTTRQVLDMLHISRTSLYNLKNDGVLVPVPYGAGLKNPPLRFRRADVERLLREGRKPAADA